MRKFILILLLLPSVLYGQVIISNSYIPPVAEAGGGPASIPCLVYLKFDGDYTDEMGNNDGTYEGDGGHVTFDGDTALMFTGTDGDDWVNIGEPALTGNYSVSFRIYLNEGNVNENYYWDGNNTSPSGAVGFASYFDGTGSGTFKTAPRVTDMTGSFNSDVILDNSVINDDTWYDIVVTKHNVDNDDMTGNAYGRIYINNVCRNCTGTPDSVFYEQAPLTYTGQDWVIGNYRNIYSTSGLREGAIIDEYKIFNYILTDALVDSLYQHPFRLPYAE